MTLAPAPVPRSHASGLRVVVGVTVAFVLAVVAVVLVARAGPFRWSSSSGTEGSGKAVSAMRHVAPFTQVELAGSSQVTIAVGAARSVVVHADDNLVDRVTTAVRNGRLVVGTRPGSFRTKVPMTVAVTVPSLDAVVLSGSGMVTLSGVDAGRLSVTMNGSGLVLGNGRVGSLDAVLSGSGDLELEGLQAATVHAIVSGSGRILVTATERLVAEVPGSGAVVYAGNPAHVSTNVTGSGTVTPS